VRNPAETGYRAASSVDTKAYLRLHHGTEAMPRSLRDSMNEVLGRQGCDPSSLCASLTHPSQRIVDKGILPHGRRRGPAKYPKAKMMKESRQPLMWQVYGSTAPSDPVERQAAFHVIKSFESNWTAPPHLSPIVRRRRRLESRQRWRTRLNAPEAAPPPTSDTCLPDDEEDDARPVNRGGERFGSVRKAKGRVASERKRYLFPPIPDGDHSDLGIMKRNLCFPTRLLGKKAFENPRFRAYHKPAFSTTNVKVAKPVAHQKDPLEEETIQLHELTGISRRSIEELRQRWWAASFAKGINDFIVFYKLLRQCGVRDKDFIFGLFAFLDVNIRGKVDFECFIRACGVFIIGEEGMHPAELLTRDSSVPGGWRGGTPPKPSPGDFTRQRAIARAQLRLELQRFFYDPQSNEEKRCANVQVNRMMAMLNEHLEPPSYEAEKGDKKGKDSDDSSDDEDPSKGEKFAKAVTGEAKTSSLLNSSIGKAALKTLNNE